MTAPLAIDVRDVAKRYRLYTERRDSLRERFVSLSGSRHEDFWALKDVSFSVERGQTFGVIGHNGSGKSTLLKLIAGIHRPTSGTITTHGRIAALLELGAGFHPDLTGRENVYLAARLLGLSKRFVDGRIDEIADFAGIDQFFDSQVKVYSSGMVTRLGFAIAVNVDPEILLVDEAISVGDEEFQRKCMEYVYRLRKAGTTIVLVSHSLGLIADLCDAALWLDHGELRAIGPAGDVIAGYLADVNQHEAPADTDADAPAAPETRMGSGEVRISGVEFIGPDGEPTRSLMSAEPARIRISYDVHEPMDDITFGLSFATESGTQIAGPNSGFGADAVHLEPGSGVVEFVVDDLLLQPNQYVVSAGVVTRLHVVDYVDSGYELPVHAAAAVTEPGQVRMTGRWEHRTNGGRD